MRARHWRTPLACLDAAGGAAAVRQPPLRGARGSRSAVAHLFEWPPPASVCAGWLRPACGRTARAIYLNVVRYRGRASDNSDQRSFLQLWAGVFLLGSEALLLRMTRWGVRRRLRLGTGRSWLPAPMLVVAVRAGSGRRPMPDAVAWWICLCPARSNLCESAKAVRTGRLPCLFRLVHRLSRRKRNVRNFSGEARQGVAREVSTWSGRWR